MSNRLFVYSLSSRTWEPMDDHAGATPEGRMNHSLVAYGSRYAPLPPPSAPARR